jgi:hypothetical protein
MKFDARTSDDPAEHASFVEWLVSETASGLSRSRGNRESLRASLFLYLNRAYEARLSPDLIADLIGCAEGGILDRAGLSAAEESAVIDEFEILAPIIEATHNDA